MKEIVSKLNKKLSKLDAYECVGQLLSEFGEKVVFTTSLGAEDQVIAYMISLSGIKAKIVFLDTGRMFYETYELLQQTIEKYQLKIEVVFPDSHEVETMVNEKGINLFYENIQNRILCCNVRKVKPLRRALEGQSIWITGIRREQSVTRKESELVEWNEEHNLIKVNPLINWTEDELWKFIRKNKVPYNILHDKGYPSIGCAPCTRAVEKGENPRNGRWWWENPETKECGLHLHVKTS